MTRMQEIKQIKKEIERLTKRLKVLETLPEPIEERKLSSFEDFPPVERHLSYSGIETVNDLICSSPEKLLKIRSIGKAKIIMIRQWMEKYGLDFV